MPKYFKFLSVPQLSNFLFLAALVYNLFGSFDLMSQEFSEGSIIYYESGLHASVSKLGIFMMKHWVYLFEKI